MIKYKKEVMCMVFTLVVVAVMLIGVVIEAISEGMHR